MNVLLIRACYSKLDQMKATFFFFLVSYASREKADFSSTLMNESFPDSLYFQTANCKTNKKALPLDMSFKKYCKNFLVCTNLQEQDRDKASLGAVGTPS